jgi:hypothetical protein
VALCPPVFLAGDVAVARRTLGPLRRPLSSALRGRAVIGLTGAATFPLFIVTRFDHVK